VKEGLNCDSHRWENALTGQRCVKLLKTRGKGKENLEDLDEIKSK
jgi:hypothetical protein